MDFSKVYATQVDRKWVSLDRLPGTQFLIAPLSNLDQRRKLQRLTKPYMARIQKANLDPAKQDDLYGQSLVGTVLLDWKNLTENGKVLKFDEDNANRLLKDFPVFYDDLISSAEGLQDDLALADQEAEENLKKQSSGKQSTLPT